MRKFIVACALMSSIIATAQSAADAAVQISVQAQNNPAQITLNWVGNATTTQYQVFRKLKTGTSWGSALATLSGTVNQYVDITTIVGVNYEYSVRRFASNYNGYGYVNSGIDVPAIENRGKLILLVDSDFIGPLSTELTRLVNDMEGDGWEVIRHNVLRTGSVPHVKSIVVNDYNLDPINTKAVFIFGHVPVPYSGNINPDGHGDHLGAWPADVFYGDVNGNWTDVTVNSTVSPPRTQNIPGDGKFDQSVISGDVELQVGRVDFNNMPAFSSTELHLLKNYLDKDHDYRKKIFVPLRKAVIADNFGYFGSEAFAASGYKNSGPLVGTANVSAGNYFTSMTNSSYLWSYGCGGGSYTSAGGIGVTSDFATSNLQGVFTMLFGSYFGDWDSQNNFLRAPLAQGKILTNVWSGRPHYQFHHMGLGENIGYSLLTTQNNPGNLYFASPTGITGKWVHNALMGDPTLRNDIVAPVSNVVATKMGFNCLITWSVSTETNVVGYNIYMKNDTNTSFVKINTNPVTGTTFTDICLQYKGIYKYMVRTLKSENTASGTYFNMSEGIADTAYNSTYIKVYSYFFASLLGDSLNLVNISSNATNFFWDLGNGKTSTLVNPKVTYTANGFYTVMLVASNSCYSDTSYQAITVTEVGLNVLAEDDEINIFPNPSTGLIQCRFENQSVASISIFSSDGRQVFYGEKVEKDQEINLSFLNKGLYFVQIRSGEKLTNKKLVLE